MSSDFQPKDNPMYLGAEDSMEVLRNVGSPFPIFDKLKEMSGLSLPLPDSNDIALTQPFVDGYKHLFLELGKGVIGVQDACYVIWLYDVNGKTAPLEILYRITDTHISCDFNELSYTENRQAVRWGEHLNEFENTFTHITALCFTVAGVPVGISTRFRSQDGLQKFDKGVSPVYYPACCCKECVTHALSMKPDQYHREFYDGIKLFTDKMDALLGLSKEEASDLDFNL